MKRFAGSSTRLERFAAKGDCRTRRCSRRAALYRVRRRPSESARLAADRRRYAAGTDERAEMIRDSSRRDVPRISSDLTSRSRDTEGSPASIFAMRDWLDWRRWARSACVRLRRRRRLRRPVASRALRSIYAASSSLRRRNSWAVPNFQPFASSRRRFSSRTVILLQPPEARVDDTLRRRPRLLAENLQDHNGVGLDPVDDSPVSADVPDAQLGTARPQRRHRSGVWHAKHLPFLQQAE